MGYTDNPHNISEILSYVVTDKERIMGEMIQKRKCYFYDTCSFRRHANIDKTEAEYFLNYVKTQAGVIIITRSILMELASHSGILNPEYVDYVRRISEYGITILLIYEEDIFSVMEICFSTNAAINEYLCWAVRAILGPVSTIRKTVEMNLQIHNEVVKGKNLDNSEVYQRFFRAVRGNKESEDNLGEEMIAICLYILAHLPGEENGKFCVLTDDKGAAGKIDDMFKKLRKSYSGKDIGILSTPKLVQILYREHILNNMEHIKGILGAGTDGNIVVLGMRIYDIRSKEISLSKDELADLIVQPNGINIVF